MNTPKVSPEKIQQLTTGGWSCAALGTAVQHKFFTRIAEGARTPDEIARATGTSPRGARALLDGLVGLGLVTVSGGNYANAPDAAEFLVEGKPSFMGGFAKMCVEEMVKWAQLPAVVKSGKPAEDVDTAENKFWEELVISIAPSSMPNALAAAAGLKIADAGPIATLDVGGGSGVYSAVFLQKNPQLQATQIDWENVNRVARSYVAGFDVADRFETIDGDFHKVDFGAGHYDVAIFSHIAHMEPPAENVTLFRKLHKALKPGGTLVVVDFVQQDDRSGPTFALLFHLNMLVNTQAGATYTESEYRAMLTEAGFQDIRLETTAGSAALVYAR
jgi:ubiquinone/menaquinone biosynthesis C-methylase UbiE